MTLTHRLPDIQSAALDGDGICLSCGTVQPVVETNPFLRGPCEVCYFADVLPARDVLRAFALVNTEPVLSPHPENLIDTDG